LEELKKRLIEKDGMVTKTPFIDYYHILQPQLRECQKLAIQTILKYLSNGKAEKSCLVCLPTGAGKSGVIATASHLIGYSHILIVTKSRAVTEQLIKDVGGRFFKKLLPNENPELKKVKKLKDDWSKDCIYLTTFKKLEELTNKNRENLKKAFDVVFIDEGHSEPALKWSQLIRDLDALKILVTATPYRNDLFKFDVDPKQNYIYTFKEAFNNGILCSPQFIYENYSSLLVRIRTLLTAQPNTKCIIKCKTFNDIEKYFSLFESEFNVCAIHEQYTGGGTKNKYCSVPQDLGKSGYNVIIHQFKLDEGVDIPEAKILVLTYAVSSGRELVQTIGRVIRKFNNTSPTIVDMAASANKEIWDSYLDFDNYLSSPGCAERFLQTLNTTNLLNAYMENFPVYSYFDSRFMKKFELSQFVPAKDLRIPLASLCFVEKKDNFQLPLLIEKIKWEKEFSGDLVETYNGIECCSIIVSVVFSNSPFLKSTVFFEPTLEVMIVKEMKNYLAVYDSRSNNYSNREDIRTGKSVTMDKLLSLAALTGNVRIKEAYARAIGSTLRRAEGIALTGENLEDTLKLESNSSYALTRTTIDNINKNGESKHSSFYIGGSSGRIADRKQSNFTLKKLSEWIDEIDEVINSGTKSKSELLNSYASPVSEVPTKNPLSLLIDTEKLNTQISITFENEIIKIEPTIKLIQFSPIFELFDGVAAKLDYVDTKPVLTGNNFIFSEDGDGFAQGDSFWEWVNKQPNKILYPDGLSYFDGAFYRIKSPFERGVDLKNSKYGRLFIGLPALLNGSLKEKGENHTNDSFDPISIFHLIDLLKTETSGNKGPFEPYIPNCDIILCTDMGTEPADFILSSETAKKLCYVHIKCGCSSTRPLSGANNISEVGNQAIKNIENATSKSTRKLIPNWSRVVEPWPSNPLNSNEPDTPRVIQRLRMIDGQRLNAFLTNNENITNVNDALEYASERIIERRRSDAFEKEIWIIVGNGFSKQHFFEQMDCPGCGNAESFQAYQLISSWISTANNYDATIKFFVSE
jgi:superfamily II DNA or RNA helicase